MRNRIPSFPKQHQRCPRFQRAKLGLMLLSLAYVATVSDPSPVQHPTRMFLCVRLRGGGQPKRTALDDAAEQTPAWKKLRTSDAESVEHLFAEDSALPISVSNERKFRGVRRQGDGFAASSKGQNVGVFPSAALAGLGYDFHNIAQHAANLTARAPILNFQDARKLYYAEVDEGRDPQAYLAALAAKVTRELSIHVNTHTQETDAAADAVAEGRGAQERIQSSSSKPGAAAGVSGYAPAVRFRALTSCVRRSAQACSSSVSSGRWRAAWD